MGNDDKNILKNAGRKRKLKRRKSDQQLLDYLDIFFPDELMAEDISLEFLETETIGWEEVFSLYSDDSEYSDIALNEENIEEVPTFQEPAPVDLEDIIFEQELIDLTISDELQYTDIGMYEDHIRHLASKKQKLPTVKNIHWQNESISMKLFPFKRLQRLTPAVTGNLPLDYFLHILTDDIINEIIIHTNDYGVKMIKRPEITKRFQTNLWKNVTRNEILVFFGLLLHMGTIRLNHTRDYWKINEIFGLNMFAIYMSGSRFSLLLRALHFAKYQGSYEVSPADELYKIRNIINLFNRRMSEIYYPGREIILDESFIFWQGKFILRQYITDKRHKYGGKVYTIATPTGIVLKCLMYTDILDDYDENKNCEKVMKFLDEYLNVGHSVYMDNYYNSFELMKLLTKSETHCTGILRRNRKTLPEEVVKAKLKEGETICRYADGVMIGKWKDTRDFTYISNEYKNDMILTKNKQNRTKLIPLPIKQYNTYAESIDKHEQLLSYYPLERKIIRWPTKLFIHLLQLIVINARHIYNIFSLRDMSLYDFRLSIISSLLNTSSYCSKLVPDKSSRGEEHLLIKNTSRRSANKKKQCRKCNFYKPEDIVYVCTVCEGSPTYCLDCADVVHELCDPNLTTESNSKIESSLLRQGLLKASSKKNKLI